MKPGEESAIDVHIVKATEHAYETLWGVLNKDKRYYNESLKELLRDSCLLCSFTGTDDIVGFTRILNHIGLSFQYITKGIELKENAKINYQAERMYRKQPEPTYRYENKFNRVGKQDPEEGKIGWNERRSSYHKDSDK